MNIIISSNEAVLIKKQLKRIEKQLIDLGSLDKINYDLEEIILDEVIEDANTLPMFSDHKLIICNNANFLCAKGLKEMDQFNDYKQLVQLFKANNPFATVVLIANDNLDKRKAIVKQILKVAKVFELGKLSQKQLIDVVQKQLSSYDKVIEYHECLYLISRVDFNVSLIFAELDKLCSCKETVITKDLIDLLVARSLENNIFELSNAVVRQDVASAIKIYRDLVMQKEEPLAMLTILANQFRLILQTKYYYLQGYNKEGIVKHLNVHPYRVELALKASNQIQQPILLNYLNDLCELDYKIKTSKVEDKLGLELFILTL